MEEDEEEKGRDVTAAGEVGRRVRVLVVDDSLVDRKIVERLLVRSGFDLEDFLYQERLSKLQSFKISLEEWIKDLIVIDSGKKAVEVLGLNEEKVEPSIAYEKKPDIVLTDYCMPEMNGYDLLKAIKESVCSKYIPVVIMSSENDPQRIRRCLDSGAEDFIMKPLQTADLQRLVNYARPSIASAPKVGTKRKLPLDSVTESTESERRPRLAGVAVA